MSSIADSPAKRSPRAVALLVVAIAAAFAFSAFVVAQNYWLDDSFISFRYARNLVDGHGLVYNPGDPVEGYTNFLWTLASALGLSFDIAPIHFTQGLSLCAQAASLWIVYEIGRAAGLRGLRPLIAPLFLAGSIAFLAYPMTGMESSAFSTLVALAFLLVLRGAHATRGGGVLLGLVFVALALTRFDGFVPVILMVSWPLFGARVFARKSKEVQTLRSWAVPLGVFAIGLVIYNGWRLSFYPTPLPNTFYAKTSFNMHRFVDGLDYLGEFISGPGLWVVGLGLVALCARWSAPAVRFLGWVVVGQFGYVAVVGGDWMPHFRFLLTVLPLLCVLLEIGWLHLADKLSARIGATGVAIVLALVFAAHVLPVYRGRDFTELDGPHFRAQDARRIGEFLAETLPEDQFLAIEWGGIIPFYAARHRTLDTFGLTDREIVTSNFRSSRWGKKIRPMYLKQRGVDFVVPCARLMPSREAALESIQPGGPNHYSYYPSLNDKPLYGYEWRILEVADGAWWPALVRRVEANDRAATDTD